MTPIEDFLSRELPTAIQFSSSVQELHQILVAHPQAQEIKLYLGAQFVNDLQDIFERHQVTNVMIEFVWANTWANAEMNGAVRETSRFLQALLTRPHLLNETQSTTLRFVASILTPFDNFKQRALG